MHPFNGMDVCIEYNNVYIQWVLVGLMRRTLLLVFALLGLLKLAF